MKPAKLFTALFLALVLGPTAFADDDRGAIEVRSQPDGATVYIEGFSAGQTPMTWEDIPVGPYRIVVKSAQHADYTEDIVVEKGETSTVTAELSAGGYSSPERADDDWTSVVGKDARKPYEKAKSSKKLGEYEVLEITSFLMKSEEPLAPEHRYAIFHDMALQLDEKTKFKNFVTNYTKGPSERWLEESKDSDAPTLVLSGVITEYQAGSQMKRYMVGFGAGKTRADCLFRLVNKQTNEVVFERMENGSVSMGFFGGSSSGAMKELGEDIAKAIKKNW